MLQEAAGSQVRGTGGKDEGVVENSRRSLGAVGAAGGAGVAGTDAYSVRDAVQGRYRDGQWYDAVIAHVREERMYVLD